MKLSTSWLDNGGRGRGSVQSPSKRFTAKIRLHVVLKYGAETNINKVICTILRSVSNADPSITFTDTQGDQILLSSVSSYDAASFNKAFGLVTRPGHIPEITVGLSIHSVFSWSRHRNAMINLLCQCNTFLKPHMCNSWSSVDLAYSLRGAYFSRWYQKHP